MRWRSRKTARPRWSKPPSRSASRRSPIVSRSISKVLLDALSQLQQSRYAGEGLASDRGFRRDPAAAGVYRLQFPLHDLRAGAVARTDRDQAQRPPGAVRPRQAGPLAANLLAQAAG